MTVQHVSKGTTVQRATQCLINVRKATTAMGRIPIQIMQTLRPVLLIPTTLLSNRTIQLTVQPVRQATTATKLQLPSQISMSAKRENTARMTQPLELQWLLRYVRVALTTTNEAQALWRNVSSVLLGLTVMWLPVQSSPPSVKPDTSVLLAAQPNKAVLLATTVPMGLRLKRPVRLAITVLTPICTKQMRTINVLLVLTVLRARPARPNVPWEVMACLILKTMRSQMNVSCVSKDTTNSQRARLLAMCVLLVMYAMATLAQAHRQLLKMESNVLLDITVLHNLGLKFLVQLEPTSLMSGRVRLQIASRLALITSRIKKPRPAKHPVATMHSTQSLDPLPALAKAKIVTSSLKLPAACAQLASNQWAQTLFKTQRKTVNLLCTTCVLATKSTMIEESVSTLMTAPPSVLLLQEALLLKMQGSVSAVL